MKNLTLMCFALCSVTLLSSCAGEPEAPPPPTLPTVTNQALGIRLTALPADFVVAANEGDTLELAPSSREVEGRVLFSVGPEKPNVNLVAAVKRHQRLVEERVEAEYKGGQELVTPLGAAFYSRGRYLAGLDEVEETAIFLLHPSQARLLTITYRYPAGVDSSVRVQQLLDILAVLEGVTEPAVPNG
jgi:hypothetical protein